MTIYESLGKWSDAATVVKANDQLIRDGNWQSLKRALRHCKEQTEITEAGTLNGDTVLEVTPDSPIGLPTFLLVVK